MTTHDVRQTDVDLSESQVNDATARAQQAQLKAVPRPNVFVALVERLHDLYPTDAAIGAFVEAGRRDATAHRVIPPAPQPMIEALTAVQRGQIDRRLLPSIVSKGDDVFRGDVLRRIRAAPLSRMGTLADRLTIELVALLFDAILTDAEVPDRIERALRRFQVPFLKCALMDKSLFSNEHHPARRLIDVVVDSTFGWGSAQRSDEVAEEIATIVEGVASKFETDVRFIAQQLHACESVVQGPLEEARPKIAVVRDQLAQRKRGAMARLIASEHIDIRLGAGDVHRLIDNFASKIWRAWLAMLYLDGAKAEKALRQALVTLDDLIWTTQPDKVPEEQRERLLPLMWSLNERLKVGLDGLSIPEHVQENFFRKLRRVHLKVVGEDALNQIGAGTPSTTSTTTSSTYDVFSDVDADEKLVLGDAGTEGGTLFAAAGSRGDWRWLEQLTIGAWVELAKPGRTPQSLQLVWTGGANAEFLFANRYGEHATYLMLSRLNAYASAGNLRLLRSAPITRRVLARLLEPAKSRV